MPTYKLKSNLFFQLTWRTIFKFMNRLKLKPYVDPEELKKPQGHRQT